MIAGWRSSGLNAFRYAGVYTGRILKGEKLDDLPVMLTAKALALALAIAAGLLDIADEVIE
jgi:hypothetical protein